MKKKICLILFFSLIFCTFAGAEQDLYDISLTFDKGGNILEKTLFVDTGFPSSDELNSKDEYHVELVSFDDKSLHKYHFDVSFILYSNPPTTLDEAKISFFLPYFKNGKEVKIYHKEEHIGTIDVSPYASINNLRKHDPELAEFMEKDIKPSWYKPKWLIIPIALILLIIIAIFIKKR